ncbi:DNA-binding transcriptional response regulator [Sphingomonas psychrotolerans]|uniref:response regulator n=1 Tax=Sphingomonas psychrotolerans TaxID=1327635 RepID=UPI001F1EFBEF|nr:response regulator [Sphingomonas psychrotolerans]
MLLIDSDDGLRRTLQLLLAGNGYDVRSFASATQALADSACGEADFLIVGDMLLDTSAANVVAELRERGWQGRAIRIGDLGDANQVNTAADSFASIITRQGGRLELLGALAR